MKEAEQAPIRALVVGAGAIGGFYGALLHGAGAEVSVVCRGEFDAVRERGYELASDRLGNRSFRPAQVLRSAGDYQGGAPDYLIVTLKVVEGLDRVALMRPAVGPHTVIVLIENGVEIEAEIAAAFPDNEVISALAFVQVSRTGPGRIRHFAFGDLNFGNYPSGVSERARRLAALLEAGGIRCPLTDKVAAARWQKALWNTVFNPISVLGGALDTAQILATAEGSAFVLEAMREVEAIAAATGHPLAPELAEQFIDATRKGPAYKTSMALDYENGRPMETEAIIGNVVRAAQREGVPAPRLASLYALLKMVERKSLPR
ncbi:ketopantoate reductase [Noviherbaspirillum humi]|uniref:2-dehydropantoate 2-reductase n=1 Tax=Noviherbaspirillum humi TaxID=1688639 RepID=A0A239HD50_9BURK|nr:2-dehydropantoate 2-reductase [Noviherbaspirillum humi]SNS79317.1 ketopantoate reductase [Noviherbaspirillum humi]